LVAPSFIENAIKNLEPGVFVFLKL
jgi:hypothetical protein